MSVPAMDGNDQATLDDILQAWGLDDAGILAEARDPTPPQTRSSRKNARQAVDGARAHVDNPQSSDLVDGSPSKGPVSAGLPSLPVSLDENEKEQTTEDTNAVDVIQQTEAGVTALPNGPSSHTLPVHEASNPRSKPADPDLSDTESDDEVTNQLSCRLGKLQFTQDGQLRYFGSTSSLHLLDVLVSVTLPAPKIAERETQEILENARLNADIDQSFEKHLLELYFSWQDPSLHLVDYDRFWEARAQHNFDGLVSPYYSRSLADAM